jgi:hypothetical protein
VEQQTELQASNYALTEAHPQVRAQFGDTNIKVYRTIILPVVWYGCETWSLTLRDERRLRVLRRISGPSRDEVTEEWRKRHNEELNDLYCSTNTNREIKSR